MSHKLSIRQASWMLFYLASLSIAVWIWEYLPFISKYFSTAENDQPKFLWGSILLFICVIGLNLLPFLVSLLVILRARTSMKFAGVVSLLVSCLVANYYLFRGLSTHQLDYGSELVPFLYAAAFSLGVGIIILGSSAVLLKNQGAT